MNNEDVSNIKLAVAAIGGVILVNGIYDLTIAFGFADTNLLVAKAVITASAVAMITVLMLRYAPSKAATG